MTEATRRRDTAASVGSHVVVVPCYNEAARLDPAGLRALAAHPAVRVLAVDDGSTDGTGPLLRAIAQDLPGMEVLSLVGNQGKGEAVRLGLARAISSGADTVGYLDADFATPAAEYLRIVSVLTADPEIDGVLGARVALLGWPIERHPARHYLGRVFATAASAALHLRVYDTQCGAKAFRADSQLSDALTRPFLSPWIFDVELLARLVDGHRSAGRPVRLLEVPLHTWTDISGSKLGPERMAGASIDLIRLAWRLRKARREVSSSAPPAEPAT